MPSPATQPGVNARWIFPVFATCASSQMPRGTRTAIKIARRMGNQTIPTAAMPRSTSPTPIAAGRSRPARDSFGVALWAGSGADGGTSAVSICLIVRTVDSSGSTSVDGSDPKSKSSGRNHRPSLRWLRFVKYGFRAAFLARYDAWAASSARRSRRVCGTIIPVSGSRTGSGNPSSCVMIGGCFSDFGSGMDMQAKAEKAYTSSSSSSLFFAISSI